MPGMKKDNTVLNFDIIPYTDENLSFNIDLKLINAIFHKDEGSNDMNDIWDDTALIQAYDRAVGLIKCQLSGDQTPTDQANKNDHKNKKKDKKHQVSWKVGDICQAVYSEDGLIYEAMIKSIDNEEGTCVVQYYGYGNEEIVLLTELMPPLPRNKTKKYHKRIPNSPNYYDNGMEWDRHSPNPYHNADHSNPYNNWFYSTPSPFSSPFSGMMPIFPPFMTGGSGPNFSSWPPGCNPPVVPTMPNMPPPPLPDDIPDSDDALASMMMACYMTGYYTGYYQGLKSAKSKDTSQPTTSKNKK